MGNCLKKLSKKLENHIIETVTSLDVLHGQQEALKKQQNLISTTHNKFLSYEWVIQENHDLHLLKKNDNMRTSEIVAIFKI
jgi:hypothetical protein